MKPDQVCVLGRADTESHKKSGEELKELPCLWMAVRLLTEMVLAHILISDLRVTGCLV